MKPHTALPKNTPIARLAAFENEVENLKKGDDNARKTQKSLMQK